MIVHIVMFQPRADLDLSTRDRLLQDIATAAKTIPSVRRMRVGQRARHGLPGYEQAMTTAYDYALIAEFDDRAGLVAYLQHPAHHTIGGHFTTSAERSLAYDYEMEEAEKIPRQD
jgi:hypothetical protein